jgi:hypothetical protein
MAVNVLLMPAGAGSWLRLPIVGTLKYSAHADTGAIEKSGTPDYSGGSERFGRIRNDKRSCDR